MTDDIVRREHLGPLREAVDAAIADLVGRDAVRRLWDKDHTLWAAEPTEIADRLGWLDVGPRVAAEQERLDAFAAGCAQDGLRHVLVMGMGGSSLFPEVVARTFPTADGHLEITVLDTTDPAAIARVDGLCPPERTLYLASSKSGSTIETRSHLELFWERIGKPEQFAVVTDPGSALGALARERGFRDVFENDPNIGGRYSALSCFGLVPAALAGVDWTAMVRRSTALEPSLRAGDAAANPGLRLGAILGAAVKAGRDKVTLVIDERVGTFGLWLEQLLAESTGKQGTGVVPIVGETIGSLDTIGDDRLFVSIGEPTHADALRILGDAGHPVVELGLDDPLDIGAQVLLWEVATALCGAVLGINAFDQPNVAEAKEATMTVLHGDAPRPGLGSLDEVLAQVHPGDYLAIQAFVDPDDPVVDDIQEARLRLRDQLHVATTFGLGPRFLHSTGQLHKGGPPSGVFVQIVGEDHLDAPIPGQAFTFSQLKHAQADGDLVTLGKHGLRAARVRAEDVTQHP